MIECSICHGNGYVRDNNGTPKQCECLQIVKHPREVILEEARDLICGPRAEDYGDVKDNFKRIAVGWSEIFGHPVSLGQVALAMDWLKTCRIIATENHEDSWKDKIGYSALGWEAVKKGGA